LPIEKITIFDNLLFTKRTIVCIIGVRMEVEYDHPDLERLAFDVCFRGRWTWEVKDKYQKVIVLLQTIIRRESLFPLSGMNFEAVPGKIKGQWRKKYDKQYSLRLDGRNRVVFTFIGPKENEHIVITYVGDYHR